MKHVNEGMTNTVIEAASAFFAERGVWGTSLGDIAKEVGISKGTLYYYFPTKDALVEAVASRTIKDIGDRLMAWVDTVKDAGSREEPLYGLCSALLEGFSLRIFVELNNYAEPESGLEEMIDRAMSEWNVMIEVGSLRMQPEVALKIKRILAAVLPFLCGLAALNADIDYTKEAFAALVLG